MTLTTQAQAAIALTVVVAAVLAIAAAVIYTLACIRRNKYPRR
jgi:hypothetical protein